MTFRSLVFVMLLGVSAANAETIDGAVIRVVDGDTIDIPCEAPAVCRERIRLAWIDTPETFRPYCDTERSIGEQAKVRLRELLNKPVTIIRLGKKDRFGRTLANIFTTDGSPELILVNEGLAEFYVPRGKMRDRHISRWCVLP